MTRTLVPLLAGLAQCQATTPPSLPTAVPSAAVNAPSRARAPDSVRGLYRALSARRRHAIVHVRGTPVCLGLHFEALSEGVSNARGDLFVIGSAGAWKLEFELSGSTLSMKHASAQLRPQGVEVATCRDQLVLGGTAARLTLNGAPVFDGLAGCSDALGRALALNHAPIDPVTGWEIDCLLHAATELSRPEPNRQ
jgi:hypothetical protein